MDVLATAIRAGVLAVALVAVGAVWWLDRPRGAWGRRIRRRLLLGVPWGTLVSVAFLLAVYAFLQGGYADWSTPVTVPFYSWSYFYPLGVVVAPFAHANPGHLYGNLLATAVLAPLAEYAWSHYPTRRGAHSFGSWRTHPYVRAFVLFPLGVVAVGLMTSVFAWGPVIGFSGVVFAFAGFGLVRYPVLAIVAVLARGFVGTAYYALRDPILEVTAEPGFSRPWWANVAVEGHLLGFLTGVAIGVAVFVYRREERPRPVRVWVATALLGSSFSLWALWWIQGTDTYVLYRGVGVGLVLALATLVTVGVRASDREVGLGVSRRTLATLALVLPLLVVAFVAVPVNLTYVDAASVSPPNGTVHVRDYDVYYAEGVQNPKVPAVNVSALGDAGTTSFTVSGVVVTSQRRQVWTEQVSKGELAFDGERAVRVGGVGWSETVWAKRVGWTVAGNDTVYQVFLKRSGGNWTPAYRSPPSNADFTIDHRNVTVRPRPTDFAVTVTRANETLGTAPLPGTNETSTAGGVRFVRNDSAVLAVRNGTRIPLATRETYE